MTTAILSIERWGSDGHVADASFNCHQLKDSTVGRGTMVMDAPAAVAPEVTEGPTDRASSRPFATATTAPSSSSTRATSAASPPTSSAWSRTTAAPRTSRRRSSSPRCAACARPSAPIAFKPWIYEIAKNACIDQFRRSRRAEEVSMDADDGLGQRRPRPPRRRRSVTPTTRSTPSSSSTTSAAPSAACPTRTTRSSCCASSRASPTARSATAWASAAPASRAPSSGPASA